MRRPGSLETSFNRMASQFEKDSKTSSMIKQAMIYPIVLLVVVAGVVVLMLTYIIPQFKDTLEGAGMDLPAITKLVMKMSDGLIHWWWLVAIIIAAIVVTFRVWSKTETGAIVLGRVLLKIPLVGDLQTNRQPQSLPYT